MRKLVALLLVAVLMASLWTMSASADDSKTFTPCVFNRYISSNMSWPGTEADRALFATCAFVEYAVEFDIDTSDINVASVLFFVVGGYPSVWFSTNKASVILGYAQGLCVVNSGADLISQSIAKAAIESQGCTCYTISASALNAAANKLK